MWPRRAAPSTAAWRRITYAYCIPVGSTPIGVTAPIGTGKVYTSDEGSNQLSAISRRTRQVVRVIGVGPKPHHMASTVVGDRVYVADYGANPIGVIDTATDTKVATFTASPSSAARTHAVYVSRDGRTVYATNEVTNGIAAIDAATGALLWNLPVGARPSEILVTPEGTRAYVSVRNENRSRRSTSSAVGSPDVRRRWASSRTPSSSVSTGPPCPSACGGRRPRWPSSTRRCFAFSTVDAAATTTGHQWLSRTGRHTFIALEGPPGVTVIDNATAGVVAHLPLPLGGQPPSASRPHGVFYDPYPL